jgi:signal transduction histidine kinase
MRQPQQRWQLIVFAGAILLPSAALLVVSQRALYQNRELAAKRRVDDRRAERERISREMLAQLEDLKSKEVVLVAPVEEGRLTLPWELAGRDFREAIAGPPAFAKAIDVGTPAENSGDLGTAVANYRQALAAAVTPLQVTYARYLLAGALKKQQRTVEAARKAREVLNSPADLMDEDAIPFAVHAAGLLDSPADRAAIREALMATAEGPPLHSPIAGFTVSNLVERLQNTAPAEGGDWAVRIRERLGAARRVHEQAQGLQSDAGRLGLLELRNAGGRPRWTFYPGAEPWLVSTERAAAGGLVVVALRAADVFRPYEAGGHLRFQAVTEPGGDLLADSFPNLKVAFAARDTDATNETLVTTLLYLALFLLVGSTAFGTLLLWRSLRREMELAETRAQFVSSVSHELKTPLTAIRMYAETLAMGRSLDKEAQNEYLETISNESERLSRLVDDVLLFSKIEQGKALYRFRPVRLADALEKAARTIAYPLAKHGFQLRMELQADSLEVDADADALEQAVLNLLTNAMKYSTSRKEIELRLLRRSAEAAIEVRDYGIGIAAAEQARIFEKYYRAPTEENRLIPGTGLGLTLVAQIAKAHGGHVDIASEPGKGSTFTIRLPLGDKS